MTALRTVVFETAEQVEFAADQCGAGVVVVDGVASAVIRRPDGRREVFTHVPQQRDGSSR